MPHLFYIIIYYKISDGSCEELNLQIKGIVIFITFIEHHLDLPWKDIISLSFANVYFRILEYYP